MPMKAINAAFLPIVVLMFLLISCANRSNNDNAKTNEKTQELDKEAIRSYVHEKGAMIARNSQKVLSSQLKKAMREGGVSNAIKYCNVKAYPLIDSMEETYGVSIKRASHRLRNPKDAPDQHEKKVLTTYLDRLDTGEKLEPVVQSLPEDKMLYAKPIMLNKPLCLNCHGKVGAELSRKDFALIKEKYPKDSAHNHRLGDLRGIWSIKFNQKQIKKNLEQEGLDDSG